MNYPKTIRDLIECYKKLPGVGEKTAERMALSTLEMEDDIINLFSDSLKNLKDKIKRCKICNNLSEEDKCEICKQNNRNKNIICVVEEPKNIIMFEKVGTYKGLYHVLDGLISPLDGINPENLNISSLIERIKKEPIEEVILALNLSMEGETTSLYILKLLEGTGVTVTKIAAGIPVGADMEYLDALTIQRALEGRNKLS